MNSGAGYDWQLYDTERMQPVIRGGVDAVSVKHNDGSSEGYPALGWGLQYSHRRWQRRVELFRAVPQSPGWERTPPPRIKSVDTTWLLGLGYEW
ncbi:MAG: DUF481 domain-containing protein [Burkholderiales bacterium]